MFALLKSIGPKGLRGRAILILLFPVIMIQLIFAAIIIQRHFDRVTRQMVDNVEPHIRLVLSRISSAPDTQTAMDRIVPITIPVNMTVSISNEPITGAADRRQFIDFSGRILIESLRSKIPSIISIDLSKGDAKIVEISASTPHGAAIITLSRRAFSPSNPHQLLVLMVFAGSIMTLIAFLFLKNQLRPIIRLAHASTAFGQGRHLELTISGATEVRDATAAFLHMRERIEKHMEQRTRMLSNIGHDLRTPLTRVRLGLETLGDSPQIGVLVSDVRHMMFMVNELLEFTRDVSSDKPEPYSPLEVVTGVVMKASISEQHVELVEPDGIETEMLLLGRPVAITRALENLVVNAARHADRCTVTVRRDAEMLHFDIEDDGPGIPRDRRDEALRPFTRLDPARNLNQGGGVGLGLSIARDVAVGHGGSIELSESRSLGGLKATFTIPLAYAERNVDSDGPAMTVKW